MPAILATDPINGYCRNQGIEQEMLYLAWVAFKAAYASRPNRRSDWPALFRRSVKGAWHRLWCVGPTGRIKLTTAGHQLKCEVDTAERELASQERSCGP